MGARLSSQGHAKKERSFLRKEDIAAVATGTHFDDDWIKGERLGAGSFAEVFECRSRHGPKINAAVKIITLRKLDEKDVEHLEDEIRILQALDHPHITKLLAVYRTPTDVRIVQELCKGGELFDRIVARTSYCEDDARALVMRMLGALAYAHSKGIVHRDIKPENILLSDPDDDVDIKLADWGLARYLSESGHMHTACGSLSYMSPEVIERAMGARKEGYTEKTDVWSAGVITFILLAGYNPFDDPSTPLVVAKVRRCELNFTHEWWKNVSEEAKDLIRHMVVRDPHKRLTARACLEHAWFKMDTLALSTHLLGESAVRISNLQARRRLKAAAAAVITANRLSQLCKKASAE